MFGLGVVNVDKEVTSLFTQPSDPHFPVSGDRMPLPSGAGKVPFKGEIYFLLSGDKEGQNVLLAVS